MAGHRSETPKKCVDMHHLCVLHAVQMSNSNPSGMYEKGRNIKGVRAEGTAEEARPALRVNFNMKRSKV